MYIYLWTKKNWSFLQEEKTLKLIFSLSGYVYISNSINGHVFFQGRQNGMEEQFSGKNGNQEQYWIVGLSGLCGLQNPWDRGEDLGTWASVGDRHLLATPSHRGWGRSSLEHKDVLVGALEPHPVWGLCWLLQARTARVTCCSLVARRPVNSLDWFLLGLEISLN